MSFPYTLPTTGAISFSDYFVDAGEYSNEISEATALRGRLRGALKEAKREDEDARDFIRIMKTIEDYLPYLVGIIACIETDTLKLKKEIEFSWRSTLGTSVLKQTQRVECKGIYYDLIFTLLTYGYTSSMWASTLLAQVSGGPDADKQYNKVADLLCTAAGIFAFVAEEVIQKWNSPDKNRPPEVVRELPAVLSKIAHADAEAVGIRKALLSARMSYSLAAKLYIGVTGHYEMASGLIGSLKTNEVSSELRRYLSEGIVFYKALAKKFLAMDANANQNIGTAAGFIKEAKESLHSLVKSTLSKTSTSAIAARAAQEETTVNEMYAMYTKVNDTVTFQAVPSKADLQTMIPGGRPLLTVKKYTLPPQAFGPVTGKPAEGIKYALEGAYF